MNRPKVLVVDDDDDVRHLTRVSLGFEGFEVSEAAHGQAGVDAIRASAPDAVVLDVMMPGRDGLDVLRELRDDPAYAALPVVILTAKAGETAERDGWAAGATAYLTKPFTGAALAATLWRLLDGDTGGVRDTALAKIDLAERLNAVADRSAR